MTVETYKLAHPEHTDLQGDALWNAMEDSLLKTQDMSEPVLTEEEEEQYQKAVIADREFWAAQGVVSVNYNRWLWYHFDKPQPMPDKPLTSCQFIVFDVSDKPEEI